MPLLFALSPLDPVIAVPVGIVGGLLLGWVVFSLIPRRTIRSAKVEAQRITETAAREGDAARQRVELEAEKKASERRNTLDKEIADALAELKKDQARIAKREDTLDRKLEDLGNREKALDKRDSQIKSREAETESIRQETEKSRTEVKKRLQ